MGCCGLFKKSKKNKRGVAAGHVAARPVQQVVQNGRVSHQPTGGWQQQSQYSQPTSGTYGASSQPMDPNLRRGKAYIDRGADVVIQRVAPKQGAMIHKAVDKGFDKGVDYAAKEIAQYQARTKQRPQQPQQLEPEEY